MSAYTDQEELEKLKAWWKSYGGALVVGVVLGVSLLFGNKYWTQYKEDQRAAASQVYEQMLQQVRESKPDAARAEGKRLIDNYDGTPYAGMAALMLARLGVEANDNAAARGHLEWAIGNATDPAVVHVARLRLGHLHVARGELDAALALTKHSAPGFEAEYQELAGDVLVAQGKPDAARAAYEQALKALPNESSSRRVLEMKIADLAGAKAQ